MSNGALTSFRSYCFAYFLDTLEAQLGLSLFDRGTTRKAKFTQQGEAVVSEARAVAHSVETLRARASEVPSMRLPLG
jgi:DNA-binding transcriptional LysR family regulator